MALIAQLARMARSTKRSTLDHGDHRIRLQKVTADRANVPWLRQACDVVDLDGSTFFVDRVEDAVASGPQAPQIRRPVRKRLRRPRLIG